METQINSDSITEFEVSNWEDFCMNGSISRNTPMSVCMAGIHGYAMENEVIIEYYPNGILEFLLREEWKDALQPPQYKGEDFAYWFEENIRPHAFRAQYFYSSRQFCAIWNTHPGMASQAPQVSGHREYIFTPVFLNYQYWLHHLNTLIQIQLHSQYKEQAPTHYTCDWNEEIHFNPASIFLFSGIQEYFEARDRKINAKKFWDPPQRVTPVRVDSILQLVPELTPVEVRLQEFLIPEAVPVVYRAWNNIHEIGFVQDSTALKLSSRFIGSIPNISKVGESIQLYPFEYAALTHVALWPMVWKYFNFQQEQMAVLAEGVCLAYEKTRVFEIEKRIVDMQLTITPENKNTVEAFAEAYNIFDSITKEIVPDEILQEKVKSLDIEVPKEFRSPAYRLKVREGKLEPRPDITPVLLRQHPVEVLNITNFVQHALVRAEVPLPLLLTHKVKTFGTLPPRQYRDVRVVIPTAIRE
jgi:hypothetical protein